MDQEKEDKLREEADNRERDIAEGWVPPGHDGVKIEFPKKPSKEYVSMFTTREIRQGLKTKAAALGFKTLIDFLEAIKNQPLKDLRDLLSTKEKE